MLFRSRQQVTLMKANYKELPELLGLALDNHFDAFSTAYYISASEDPENSLDEEDIIYLKNIVVKQLISIIVENGMNKALVDKNIARLAHFYEFEDVSISRIAQGYYRKTGDMCYERNKLIIYPNGDLVPCTGFDYIMNKTSFINVMHADYKQIMESPLFANFWDKSFPLCERCSSGHQIWLDLKR